MIGKGTYVLFLNLPDFCNEIGSLGTVSLPKGCYCYVGSAMNGLDQRLRRHLSHEKKIRWHIDRLTVIADGVYAYISAGDFIPECKLAEIIENSGGIPVIKGFGCFDCKCKTHLFSVNPAEIRGILEGKSLTKFVTDI